MNPKLLTAGLIFFPLWIVADGLNDVIEEPLNRPLPVDAAKEEADQR